MEKHLAKKTPSFVVTVLLKKEPTPNNIHFMMQAYLVEGAASKDEALGRSVSEAFNTHREWSIAQTVAVRVP